jgi:hypothetical protein
MIAGGMTKRGSDGRQTAYAARSGGVPFLPFSFAALLAESTLIRVALAVS